MIRLRNIYLYAPNQSCNVNKRMLFFSNVTRIIAGISGSFWAIQLPGAALFFLKHPRFLVLCLLHGRCRQADVCFYWESLLGIDHLVHGDLMSYSQRAEAECVNLLTLNLILSGNSLTYKLEVI